MEAHEVQYGYAEYIDANGMTVSVDGRVQISAMELADMSICPWTTDRKWYPPYLDKNMDTAYIIHKDKADEFVDSLETHENIWEAHQTDNYIIYMSDMNYTWQ